MTYTLSSGCGDVAGSSGSGIASTLYGQTTFTYIGSERQIVILSYSQGDLYDACRTPALLTVK